MAERSIPDDDDLEELPPLDGDSRDKPESDPDYGDVLDDAVGDATLDDATAEDDPPDTTDLDLDRVEGGWLGEAGEAGDFDTGDAAVDELGEDAWQLDDGTARTSPERGPNQDEEPGVGDEDFGLDDAPERGGLDTGDEGPLDADEELRESDLPALDADDEGELDDAVLLDAVFPPEEALGPGWAADPWLRVGAPVALVGSTAVACAGRGALVAGRSESGAAELVRLDLEGTCERLPAAGLAVAEVCALAVEGRLVAAVLVGGQLLVSRDDGAHFSPVASPMAEGIAASAAVFASARLWARTRAGGLVVLDTAANVDSAPPALQERAPHLLERCPLPGIAAALTCDTANGTVTAAVLVVDGSGRPAALVRIAPGVSIRREVIDMPEADSPALFAARGESVAYAARHGGLVRRTSESTWRLFEWEGRITALAFVDDAGTLIASTYSDADDTSALVRLDAAGGASVVARIGAVQGDSESDGCVVAMAHDEAHGVLWAAGGFGVVAYAIR